MRVRRSEASPWRTASMAAAVAAGLLIAGCGGGTRQDANEPRGVYQVEVVEASFPQRQGLAETQPLQLTVRNTGDKPVPNLAVTVDGFGYRQTQPGDADPLRPLWVVNIGPRNGKTAYVNTWAVGQLDPDRERTLTWSVTAMVPGTHTLRYRVAAGLDGRASAVTAEDQPVEGDITVRVTRRPRESRVDPQTGAVIYSGE